MRKTIALVLSLFALAYVGLVYADDGENGDGQNTNQEQSKKQWERNREQEKQRFEQERENLKQEWEKTRETLKNERDQFKEQLTQRLDEKKKLIGEFKQKFTEDRCVNIEEKVQERLSHFDEREGKHQKVYNNLVNRVNKFIIRFKAAGLTTTTLEGYLAELQTKIDKFKSDYAAYIAKLKESKNLTCGHAEGEFKGSLVETRALLKIVHEDAAEIRTYVRTTILPEIKVLQAQMPEEQDDKNRDEENKDENENDNEILKSVSIVSPASNTTYSAAATLIISAKAEESDSVSKVEFYDGTELKGTDTTKSFSYNWAITASDNGPHSWTARAYDKASPANTVVSAAVNLTVAIPTLTPTP